MLHVALVILAVSFVSFVVLDLLPGDAAVSVAGQSATPERIEAIRQELGLDKPVLERYLNWVGDVGSGDLGRSQRTGIPVSSLLGDAVPASIELIVCTLAFGLILGSAMAIYGAYRPRSRFDNIATLGSFTALSLPTFISGMFMILIFARWLGWLPSTGYVALTENPWKNIRHLALPVLALGLREAATFRQLLRVDMLNTLKRDFIIVARSKGLSNRQILLTHALRPSLVNVVTLIGLSLGSLISNTVIVETVFGVPGLGSLLVQSVNDRDYVLLQGVLLVISVTYVLANAGVDALYSVLDPRLRVKVGPARRSHDQGDVE